MGVPALLLGAGPLACGSTSGVQTPEAEAVAKVASAYSGYVANIIWNDEFQSGSLDRSKWSVSDQKYNASQNSGSCFNNEAQAYIDNEGCSSGNSTLCVFNDYLHIVARYWPNAPNQCGHTTNYASARLTTKGHFDMNPYMGAHGIRVEALINMPSIVNGSWPAFWMLGTDAAQWPNPGSVFWPQSGEMDIGEWGSAWSYSQNLSTVHYATQTPVTFDGQYHAQLGPYYSSNINPSDWHTYGLEWTPSSITYFLDGNPTSPALGLPTGDFLNNFDIILNFAMGGPGGNNAGIDPSLVPQGTTSAGSGFTVNQRMAVDWVRVSALNDVGGNMTRVFEQRENNAALPVEWDYGNYKGDCGSQAAIAGLSTDLNGNVGHGLLCWNGNAGEFTGAGVTTLAPVSSGDHRRYSRNGDWDSGYYKSECGTNEYVSGISQAPGSGAVHGLRCASASMTSSGTANCETHLVTQDDGVTFDWDSGYHKGQCGGNKVVVGVSANPSNGQPHRILCCSQ